MEINGKIIQLLEKQTGEGKNGTWQKQDYILETEGQYPKKVCFNLWGDKIEKFGMKEGDVVVVSCDLESREFNSKWYTDVKAWNVVKKGEGSAQPQNTENRSEEPSPFDATTEDFTVETGGGGDDLPF